MIALANSVNHLQQIDKAEVCAKDLMFVVRVSEEVSYGVTSAWYHRLNTH